MARCRFMLHQYESAKEWIEWYFSAFKTISDSTMPPTSQAAGLTDAICCYSDILRASGRVSSAFELFEHYNWRKDVSAGDTFRVYCARLKCFLDKDDKYGVDDKDKWNELQTQMLQIDGLLKTKNFWRDDFELVVLRDWYLDFRDTYT
ncbi:Hypothetical protein D9617_48g089480 [Elsinoe fawcettii]|nr:Hypothetical protein D9617_48g089480 [Elsinoe fawcettii]